MKILVSAMVMATLVAGCATEEQQAQTQGTAIGAGGGLIVGTIIGVVAGGKKGALIGGVSGLIAGGVIGNAYANSVIRRHKEVQGKENDLDAQITSCRELNDDTVMGNEKIAELINAYESRINDLKAKASQGKNQQDALNLTKKHIEEDLKNQHENQHALETELTYRKKIRSKVEQSPALDAEIAKLERNLAQLKKNTAAMAALDQRL